jgi:hypothetical protein
MYVDAQINKYSYSYSTVSSAPVLVLCDRTAGTVEPVERRNAL